MDGIVVLYATHGVGHLVPMVELAKLLLTHNLSPTIVVPSDDTPAGANSIQSSISRMTADHPAISFHLLPPVSLRADDSSFLTVLRLANPLLLDFIRTLTAVRALILDFFCTDALDVAADLRLPAYFFFSSCASTLAAFLHLPTFHSETPTSFQDLGDDLVHFPGLPPMPASHFPTQLQDRESDIYKACLFHFDRLSRADGILVNTFRSLEDRPLQAISEGLCVPGRRMGPVYCMGPLIGGLEKEKERQHECLSWLDAQPKQSVLFLCFGSRGVFPAEQLKEVATGLEWSGQRFLWVVRGPPEAADVGELLPEGFVGRTGGRGRVVTSWAPQVAVLGHESVGGFVTHCGWNSVLEGVCAGVPMIGWPMYAEQRMNLVSLVSMGLAVEVKGYERGTVRADEVEARVRWLMEAEGGRELRDRTAAAKERAVAAISQGGESQLEFVEFVAELKRGLLSPPLNE